jgi:NADH-quinone oxidoreductase subunit C
MQQLTKELIQEHINTKLETQFDFHEDAHGIFITTIPLNQVYRLIHFLYKDDVLGFQFLTTLCAVHYPHNPGKEFEIVYHLHNMQSRKRLRIKTYVGIDKPEVPSITGIYGSANWMERETYDFFGIRFLGHPNLKRILNMDEMVEFPMRKEFPLEDPTREDKLDYQFGR